MPVRQCSLGCCNQKLRITSINKNEERKAKSKNTTGLRISVPRPLHHFVSTSLQQGLYLYKLSHVAMVTFAVTASSTFPLGSQHHLRPAALLSCRQDRDAWETKPCLLPVVQAEPGTHHWAGSGPAKGCHSLPFVAFCKNSAGYEHGIALSCCKNLSCPGKVRSLLLSMPLVQL